VARALLTALRDFSLSGAISAMGNPTRIA